MLGGLITFLIAILILVVVLVVIREVMKLIPLDESIKRIAWLIIGLLALIVLIILAVNVFGGGPGWRFI